jgi:phage recombination protein Bet
MFLELAARYDLDPFAREIWCAVPKAEDGSPRTDKVLIMVGRDGFLKIAQRNPDYRGMDSDVVRENDDFTVERTQDGKRLISHKYGRERGKAVAAYAIVYREGREPTYFHAAIEDFKPANPNAHTQWAKGPGPMILKCAEASALRRAFSISGIVAEEEVARDLEQAQAVPVPEPEGPPELVDRIRSLFEQARMLDEDAYTPAKQRLMLAGASEDRLLNVERELRDFIVSKGGIVTETVTDVVEEPDGEVDTGGAGGQSEGAVPEPKGDQGAAPTTQDAPEDAVRKAAERAMRAHGIADDGVDDRSEPQPDNVDDDGTVLSDEEVANRAAEAADRHDRDPEDDPAVNGLLDGEPEEGGPLYGDPATGELDFGDVGGDADEDG